MFKNFSCIVAICSLLTVLSSCRKADPPYEPRVTFEIAGWGDYGSGSYGAFDKYREFGTVLEDNFYERKIIESVYGEEFEKLGFKNEVPQRFLQKDLGLVLRACQSAEYRIYRMPHEFKTHYTYRVTGYTYTGPIGESKIDTSEKTTYYSMFYGPGYRDQE